MTKHDPQQMVNIASYLPAMAKLQPYRRAVVFPAGRDQAGRVTYSHMTFEQLEQESNRIASGLESLGIKKGTKTILMVKPSLEFFALTFAVFKVGAVPVMVDPGMGLKRMLHCFQSTQPEAFIGIPLAHAVRVFFPRAFRSVRHVVTVGKRWFWGGPTLEQLSAKGDPNYGMEPTQSSDLAAILFTTGSTGPPKGVVYSHGTFDAQVHYLKSVFGIQPGEVDLPTFPLFALFAPALGMTAIVPDMDPTRPAKVHPERIIEAIHNHGVTNMFGSPALLNRVARYGTQHNVQFPTLKRVISAGAPVPSNVMEMFLKMLPEGAEIRTPYGATEALPVCAIGSQELLHETREATESGKGTCVGLPMPGHTLHIIRISDENIPEWSEDWILPEGEIGEIVVQGTIVTQEYYEHPEATAKAKIYDGENLYHRMGDVGWRDDQGRIWFCGRKAHRVETADETLFTIPCEAIFNRHDSVYRSALVGIGERGHQIPVILIELEKPQPPIDGGSAQHSLASLDLATDEDSFPQPSESLAQELFALADTFEHTRSIQHLLFHSDFPVDIRHNAKIFREKLSVWTERKMKSAYTKQALLPKEAS